MSVCPSVLVSRPGTDPRTCEIETSGFCHNSLEYIVIRDKFHAGGRGFFSNEGEKKGTPPKRRYFTAIGLFSVEMVADRYRHAAHYNKH